MTQAHRCDEVAELRRRRELLALGQQIQCPVVAIHGDYYPHPAEGVQKPLAAGLDNFRFILLERCGHLPWIEREARAHSTKSCVKNWFSQLSPAVKAAGLFFVYSGEFHYHPNLVLKGLDTQAGYSDH